MAVQLPRVALLGGVDHDRRAHRPHRRQVRDHARDALRRDSRRRRTGTGRAGDRRLDRRRFLGHVRRRSGLVTLFTVGQTVGPLRKLALLAPRRPDTGPQGFPVNRTAAAAGVVDAARIPTTGSSSTATCARRWSSRSTSSARCRSTRRRCPIACVEGWSTSQTWRGVRVRDLLDLAGAPADARVRVHSLQQRRAYARRSSIPTQAHDPDTLLALRVDGEALHLDHGYPLRLIGPNRPG